MIQIEAVIAPLPGCEAALEALALEAMRATRAEAGCLVYRFTRDLEEPLYHVIEQWADEDAVIAHLRGAPFAAFRAGLPAVATLVSSRWRRGSLDPYQRPEI